VNDAEISRLFDLADLVLAVGRQIRASQDRAIDMCTPVESAVIRFIQRNPGTSARAASEATLLPSSNFSRVLRTLEEKGLVRRDVAPHDGARAVSRLDARDSCGQSSGSHGGSPFGRPTCVRSLASTGRD